MAKEYYGIDISGENGKIDWTKFNTNDISFAILRVTDKYGIDEHFENNFAGAKTKGLKIGGYKFSYAKTADDCKAEAESVVKTLAGRKLDFPIFLDLESDEQATYSSYKIGTFIEAFREVVEAAGYKFGIYTNKNWYKNIIPDSAKEKYEFWVAAPPLKENDDGKVHENLRPSFGVGWQYSWNGKIAGHNDTFDMDIFYKDYSEPSEKEVNKVAITANDILNAARGYIGCNEYDGSHKKIIDIYNSHKPLARGYAVQYGDQWCDTFVSAMFVKLNAVDLIGGTECGVEEHVKIFKNKGIWIEDGTITPKPGDIIVFNWGDNTQPNDGYSDHIGFVEKVSGGKITTIEGNYKDSVARRTLAVGHGNIRGYARPKYDISTASEAPSVSPSPAPVVAKTHATVRLNSYSDEVRVLQQYLNKVGYTLEVDGKFGLKTYAAVRNYQASAGLEVDGIVGPLTWASLEKKIGSTASKSLADVAKDVIAGKYGNMPDRKARLTAAGYDYDAVQKEVNKLLRGE